MRFKKWFATFSISSLIKSVLNWFEPIDCYEEELNSLLSPREQCYQLYKQLLEGRKSEELIASIKQMAADEKISVEQRGKANLLLSAVYSEDIQSDCFNSTKDLEAAAFYGENARKLLGNEVQITNSMEVYLECIRCGGESQYALNKLKQYTQAEHHHLAGWAHKILSYVYLKGISSENLLIIPDQNLAEQYREKARLLLSDFETSIERLATKLMHSRIFKDRANKLLQRISFLNYPQLKFKYGQFLETQHVDSEKFLPHYLQAAKSLKESPLNFAAPASPKARERLVEYFDQNKANGEYENKIKHLKLKLAVNNDELNDKYARAIISNANTDFLGKLQAGIYYLSKESSQSSQIAETFFKGAVAAIPTHMTDYELTLFEKFCIKLASYYEQLFLAQPSTVTFVLDDVAKDYLEKAIYYYNFLPKYSKKYDEIHYRIANYQFYFLNDTKRASATFLKLCTQGNVDAAYHSILCGFKDYWDSLQTADNKQQSIKEYERTHLSFFNVLKEIDHNQNLSDDLLTLLKTFLTELESHYKSLLSVNPSLEDAIKRIAKLIKNVEENIATDFVGKSQSQFSMNVVKAADFVTPKKTPSSMFFSSNESYDKFFKVQKIIMVGILNVLKVIIKQQEQNQFCNYFRAIKDEYFNYLITVCNELFPVNQVAIKLPIKDITNKGVLINAK
jgi:hypothetical protein